MVTWHLTMRTVYRQMPGAGNITKTMTSNGTQFTVTREMLTAVALDQSVLLKVACCCLGNLSTFFKICFCFTLLYNKSLNDWSLGGHSSRETLRFSGNKIHCCLRDQSLSANYATRFTLVSYDLDSGLYVSIVLIIPSGDVCFCSSPA